VLNLADAIDKSLQLNASNAKGGVASLNKDMNHHFPLVSADGLIILIKMKEFNKSVTDESKVAQSDNDEEEEEEEEEDDEEFEKGSEHDDDDEDEEEGKSAWKSRRKAKKVQRNADYLKISHTNPLSCALPFPSLIRNDENVEFPRFIALVIESEQSGSAKLSDNVSEVISSWRKAMRIHDIPEHFYQQGGSLTSIWNGPKAHISHEDKPMNPAVPPKSMFLALAALVDSWSWSSNSSNSFFSSSSMTTPFRSGIDSDLTGKLHLLTSVEAECLESFTAEDFYKVGESFRIASPHMSIIGAGYIPIVLYFIRSELRRLADLKGSVLTRLYEEFMTESTEAKRLFSISNDCHLFDKERFSTSRPSCRVDSGLRSEGVHYVLVCGLSGSGGQLMSNHITDRLRSSLKGSNATCSYVTIDFHQLNGSESDFEISCWIKSLLEDACKVVAIDGSGLCPVIVVNLVLSCAISCDLNSVADVCNKLGKVVSTISIISPFPYTLALKADGKAAGNRNLSNWHSISKSLCHASFSDVIIFLGNSLNNSKQLQSSDSTQDLLQFSELRSLCSILSPDNDSIYKVNSTNIRVDDEVIELILTSIATASAVGSNALTSKSSIIRATLYPVSSTACSIDFEAANDEGIRSSREEKSVAIENFSSAGDKVISQIFFQRSHPILVNGGQYGIKDIRTSLQMHSITFPELVNSPSAPLTNGFRLEPALLILLAQNIFPRALVSDTTGDLSSWSDSPSSAGETREVLKGRRSHFSRAVQLAKIKVMTMKKLEKGKEYLLQQIQNMKTLYRAQDNQYNSTITTSELDNISQSTISLHAMIRINKESNKRRHIYTDNSANSAKSSKSGMYMM
jgi:hypothetical protein